MIQKDGTLAGLVSPIKTNFPQKEKIYYNGDESTRSNQGVGGERISPEVLSNSGVLFSTRWKKSANRNTERLNHIYTKTAKTIDYLNVGM